MTKKPPPIKLTRAQRAMLAILDTKSTPFPPGILGAEMWAPKSTSRKPQHYARPAGNVLKRLESFGYVRQARLFGSRAFGWEITGFGRMELRHGRRP